MGLHRFAAPSFPLKLLAAVQTAIQQTARTQRFGSAASGHSNCSRTPFKTSESGPPQRVNSNGACSRFYMILDALHLPSHDHSGTGVLPQRTAQSSAGFHAAHDAVCREQEPRLLWSKFSSTAAYSAQDSRQCCCGPPQQDAPAPSPIIREPKLWPVRIVARTGK